jgi:hypothetical protein
MVAIESYQLACSDESVDVGDPVGAVVRDVDLADWGWLAASLEQEIKVARDEHDPKVRLA